MTTAAALTYRAIARMLKDVAAAWSKPNRPAAGPLLSGLGTLSEDKLRLLDAINHILAVLDTAFAEPDRHIAEKIAMFAVDSARGRQSL